MSKNVSQNSNIQFNSSPRTIHSGSSYRTARSRSQSKERNTKYKTSNGQRFRQPRIDTERGRITAILTSKQGSMSSQRSVVQSPSHSSNHNQIEPTPILPRKFMSPFPQNVAQAIPHSQPAKDIFFSEPVEKSEPRPDLVLFMNEIVEKLSAVRDNHQNFEQEQLAQAKQRVYSQICTFIDNCERVDLGFDILVGHKLAKYMHLAYSLLLSINESESELYKELLVKLNRLNKFCKSKVVSFVRNLNSKKKLLYWKIRSLIRLKEFINQLIFLKIYLIFQKPKKIKKINKFSKVPFSDF